MLYYFILYYIIMYMYIPIYIALGLVSLGVATFSCCPRAMCDRSRCSSWKAVANIASAKQPTPSASHHEEPIYLDTFYIYPPTPW